MLRSSLIAGSLLIISFSAGVLNARRHPSAAPTSLAAPLPLPVMATRLPSSDKHMPRFTPPPLPTEVQASRSWSTGRASLPRQRCRSAHERDDRRLEELFGTDFPVAKRDAVRAAQLTWMREHQHAVQDYYTGEIDQAELALKVHQNMLVWAAQLGTALSPDEFRKFTDLQPGADPYVQLVPPGVRVGDYGEHQQAQP